MFLFMTFDLVLISARALLIVHICFSLKVLEAADYFPPTLHKSSSQTTPISSRHRVTTLQESFWDWAVSNERYTSLAWDSLWLSHIDAGRSNEGLDRDNLDRIENTKLIRWHKEHIEFVECSSQNLETKLRTCDHSSTASQSLLVRW